ncbi:MAG: hypothetical protein KKA99_06960 [Gammaproteobacteria bacterium]|nr:hypothetical protein [Gammaproteobacteria bacterium]MBU2546719.1 hypothetical protein [Gammaproteobacteria bacterium]
MKEIINPQLNAEYVISDPGFHDANLTKVELLPEETVSLLFVTLSSAVYEIILHGVKHLNCTSFKEGNTVFEIIAWSSKEYPLEELRNLLNLQVGKSVTYLNDVAKKIEKGNLTLFIVNPSYGCELVCLCGSYKIIRIS